MELLGMQAALGVCLNACDWDVNGCGVLHVRSVVLALGCVAAEMDGLVQGIRRWMFLHKFGSSTAAEGHYSFSGALDLSDTHQAA